MTIATDAGFVVGNEYQVINADGWEGTFIVGDWVTFNGDDDSIAPYFKVNDNEVVALMLGRLDVGSAKERLPSSPRFRKKRIAPPVRLKTDIRITYRGDIGYTITNAKHIIVSKESGNVFITSDIKGIITTVELPLKDIDSIKVKTPKGIYDIFVEGAYPSILIINKTEGLTFSGGYFSLNLDNK